MDWTMTARITTAIAAALLMGCATKGAPEAEFGDAVRHMTEQQTYNTDAAYNPDPNPVLGGDADRLNNVLDAHRNSVSDPAEAVGVPETGIRTRSQ